MSVTKTEIVDQMAAAAGISKIKAGHAYNAFVAMIGASLEQHGDVVLPGFLSAKVVVRPERTYTNPRDGSPVVKPAHKAVTAKLSKKLADLN